MNILTMLDPLPLMEGIYGNNPIQLYPGDWNEEHQSYYWIKDTQQNKIIGPVGEGQVKGRDERPDPRYFKYEGRTFVVWYYHDGQPLSVREVEGD